MRGDSRPIGVFDSGLGGLSAVRELVRLLPHENIVYFGDTGRVPYGSRSEETIRRYAAQDIAFLKTKNPKAIVIACGTISSVALSACRAAFDGPVLGVIEPACRVAAEATENGKIGVIATASTVASGAFPRQIQKAKPTAEVQAVACPLFVSLVETGFSAADDPVPLLVAQRYLEPLAAFGCDTLILGCTHFPLLRPVIARVMGDGVRLIDTGAEVAAALVPVLQQAGLANTNDTAGHCEYFVSDRSSAFGTLAQTFLGTPVDGHVTYVDLEKPAHD